MNSKVQEKKRDWIKYHIQLTAAERKELIDKTTKGSSKAAHIIKAHVLLGSDQNNDAGRKSEKALAVSLHISIRTVERIRREFCERGMHIFIPKPRKIREDLRIDGAVEARIIALACSEPPPGQSRWTLRVLADKAVELQIAESLSHTSVAKVLKKMRSSPGARKDG
jgi:transposase